MIFVSVTLSTSFNYSQTGRLGWCLGWIDTKNVYENCGWLCGGIWEPKLEPHITEWLFHLQRYHTKLHIHIHFTYMKTDGGWFCWGCVNTFKNKNKEFSEIHV